MPVFHTKTIESILEPVAQQVSLGKHPPLAGPAVSAVKAGEGAIVGGGWILSNYSLGRCSVFGLFFTKHSHSHKHDNFLPSSLDYTSLNSNVYTDYGTDTHYTYTVHG